jgi:hypothetical protein
MFLLEDKKLSLIGPRNCRIFRYGREPVEMIPGTDLSFLLARKSK